MTKMIVFKNKIGKRFGVSFFWEDWKMIGRRTITRDDWLFEVFSLGPLSFRTWIKIDDVKNVENVIR